MHQPAPPPAAQSAEFPMPKAAIIAMCFLLTPLCGAIMYYAWKSKNPVAANYANKISWLSWLAWIGILAIWRFAIEPNMS